jgi:hypothetical protein
MEAPESMSTNDKIRENHFYSSKKSFKSKKKNKKAALNQNRMNIPQQHQQFLFLASLRNYK